MHEVVTLVAETVYLGVEVSGRFSPTEDCSTVSETVHRTAEAIAVYSSTNPNVLHVIIAHHAMILVSHERQERVYDPLSGGVMTMVLMVPFRQGAILSTLGTAGCLTSWRCVASSQQRPATRREVGARR